MQGFTVCLLFLASMSGLCNRSSNSVTDFRVTGLKFEPTGFMPYAVTSYSVACIITR